jgi:hypothetical protein
MAEVLHSQFDVKILCLSIGISFIGSYVTICLCEQLRLSAVGHNRPKILKQDSLLAFMSCSLGGVGIWCMHFVGMSALQLATADGMKVKLNFDILFTIISLVVVLCLTLLGLFISSKDIIFRKTKSEVIEMFVESSKEMSFKEIQRLKNGSGILCIICLQSLWRLALGGAITGSGVVVMHYLGDKIHPNPLFQLISPSHRYVRHLFPREDYMGHWRDFRLYSHRAGGLHGGLLDPLPSALPLSAERGAQTGQRCHHDHRGVWYALHR